MKFHGEFQEFDKIIGNHPEVDGLIEQMVQTMK
jgi:hypothetical protein